MRSIKSKLAWTTVGLIAAYVLLRLAVRGLSPRPADLGLQDGKLRDCPASPNCVCSQADDAGHVVAPLSFSSEPAQARERLKRIVGGMPGARLVAETDNWLHYEFTTRWMGFVDDVEFLIDATASQIHCRSASRLGYSDLGVNRRRIDAIRQKFANSP